jgi:hypothetical protein
MAAKKTTGKGTVQVPAEAERVTRIAAANQVVAAVNGKTTLLTLAKEADALFVAGGGESKMRAATASVRRALLAGEALGVFKLTKPEDLYVERIKGK